MENLVDLSTQLLNINKDFKNHLKSPEDSSPEDFDLYTFEQTWGNTSGPLEAIGGQVMTTCRTWVFYPVTCADDCIVYFGGSFGYKVPCSKRLTDDIRNANMAGMRSYFKYLKVI